MKKRLGQKWLTGVVVAGVIVAVPSVVWSQVAGRVQTADGSALSGATVEIWDNYPAGSILTTAVTNGSGEFSAGAVVPSAIDLRVQRVDNDSPTHHPTVVRDLPQSTGNTSVRLSEAPVVPGNPINWCDFYHGATTFLDVSVAEGDVVEAFGQSGSPCGVGKVLAPGGWLLHAFGDDPTTVPVDGPQAGEQLSFRVNGLAAAINNAPITFSPSGNTDAHVVGTSSVPGVTLTAPTQAAGNAGKSAMVLMEVTNTGNVAGDFTVSVELDQPWTVTIQSVKGLNLNLAVGESADVLAEILIPNGAADQTVEFRARVTSDIYEQANSGAWTAIEVSTVSDIGDDNGDGLVPKGFSLAQNYPNPFNAGTNISFTLAKSGHVHLAICNLLGQEIRTLVDGYREPGQHIESWDGRDQFGTSAPSGIYFARLSQSGKSEVRKMVLLK